MRSYCLMCHTPADFIDLKTGECENCCADPVNSKLVSRQSVAGATRNLQVRHEILHGGPKIARLIDEEARREWTLKELDRALRAEEGKSDDGGSKAG